MFLYLVRPESSRTFCCKVYKWIGVVFRWFFPEVLRELSRWVNSVYWSVTKVAWEAWRIWKVLTEVVYLLSCNREVTWIFGKRPFLYKSYGSPSVVSSLAWACCEVLSGITAFVWNKYSGCVFDIPAFWLDNKLPTTLKHRTCNSLERRSLKKNQGFTVKRWFFQASSFQLVKLENLNWIIYNYCDDHSSLWSTTAVQIYELFHIYFTSKSTKRGINANIDLKTSKLMCTVMVKQRINSEV